LGKNGISLGQASHTCVAPNQKINNAEELAYLSIKIGKMMLEILLERFYYKCQ
jgi:hypothetical protein